MMQTKADVLQGVSHKHCTVIQRACGYDYLTVAKKGMCDLGGHKAGNALRFVLFLLGLWVEVSHVI